MIHGKKEQLKAGKWKMGQNASTFHQELCLTNLVVFYNNLTDFLGKNMQKIF